MNEFLATAPARRPGPWQRLVARLATRPAIARFLARVLYRIDRPLLRLTGGRIKASLGFPILLLTTTGARSGQPRTVPLIFVRDGDELAVIASYYGNQRHPAWYHNIQARPEVTVLLPGRSGPYRARLAQGAERERLWQRAQSIYPGYETYDRQSGDRTIPVVILTPATRAKS